MSNVIFDGFLCMHAGNNTLKKKNSIILFEKAFVTKGIDFVVTARPRVVYKIILYGLSLAQTTE